MWRIAGMAVLGAVLAGCDQPADPLPGHRPPAAGPLGGPAAAVRALACAGRVFGHGRVGAWAAAGDSPVEALGGLTSGYLATVPDHGYRVRRREPGRVLLTYRKGVRTEVAVVTARLADGSWRARSWAQCDPAEFPDAVTRGLGIGVWLDSHGRRVPVALVRTDLVADATARQAAQRAGNRCARDVATVRLGTDLRAHPQYLRDVAGQYADRTRVPFSAQATLPAGAQDTSYHRAGRELWVGPGQRAVYLVDRRQPSDVERWPAARPPLACG